MSDTLDFYFDFSSPYSYFAGHKIDDIAHDNGRTVNWKPILLGPIFQKSGVDSPINVPMKGEYSRNDCDRMARFMDIPWQMPDPFPIFSVTAARAFYWVHDQDPDQARTLAKSLFHGFFGEGKDITDADVVADIASALHVNRDDLLSGIADPAIKQRLKDETAQAMEIGVFGAPYFIVDGEPFWGSDRLWMVKKWLQRGGW
ncbi:MAG TPA: 2-hydroxychromene-2-carboxylate isomerase [Rhodospirillales bacterium]|nr:2-hydroxychromene-2-carboxylate isomerase [Rhodospirillales bacterium]